MSTDLIDHMLRRAGDYVLHLDKYADLRAELRKNYGGPNRPNEVLLMLDATISEHLSRVSLDLAMGAGVDSEDEYMKIIDRVTEQDFRAAMKVTSDNIVSADLVLLAEVLDFAGITTVVRDEFREMIEQCANQM